MSGDELTIVAASVAAGACIGALLGALATLLVRAKREQALRLEGELLRARIKSDDTLNAERQAAEARAREHLGAVFGALSRDSLQSNSEVFLQLAGERLARHQQDASSALQQRETAIESLVQPLREALAKTEAQMQSIERERIDAFATIKSQMEALGSGQNLLSRETRNLVTALRRPAVRGQWGEITLKRLVELSGMTAHVDFTEQQHRATDSGAIRPDMIVHMPERRDIVVDVKTPLEAYLAAVEAQHDEERAAQLKRHAQIVGARVRELSSKQYWSQFERSPDFVVLFLPGDQFLAAALEENPGLIDESLRQNVMLATPTSLVALLKAVAYGWKQGVLADNAAEIRRLGEEVYKRLAVFGEHLGKLGKALGGSVESFNKAVGSLEQQVLPAARRFPDLGLRVDRDLVALEPVGGLTRTPRGSDAPAPGTTLGTDSAPRGAAGPDTAPQEAVGPDTAPRGVAGPDMAPQEAVGPDTAPREALRPDTAPREAVGPDSTPREAVGPDSAPRGAVGPDSAPRGAVGPDSAPRGAVGPDTAPREALRPDSAPREAMGLESAPREVLRSGSGATLPGAAPAAEAPSAGA